MSRKVLDAGFLHIDDIPSDVDLVAELQAIHTEGVEIPWIWNLAIGPDDPTSEEQSALSFGINNATGALQWSEGDNVFVPAAGTNPEWAIYYIAGMHDAPVPPHAEVHPDTVFAALAEFLQTRARPTCVDWTDAESFTALAQPDAIHPTGARQHPIAHEDS
ncbi:Imm1 family immunity protein [Actinokineospora sp.]|uniref:Imm1 family immunity protein n=1 Tax=Actinokineospora sp. TaxID=1872133 RepID=UPI0040383C81